jgi:hypothetical protein
MQRKPARDIRSMTGCQSQRVQGNVEKNNRIACTKLRACERHLASVTRLFSKPY